MVAQADAKVLVAWRAERRRAARNHHPDVGGDTQEYLRVIAAIDSRYGLCVDPGGGTPTPARVITTTPVGRLITTRRAFRRGVRCTRRLIRTIQTRLPRSIPGARRYTSL
ncbi:MAG: hypothetical protein ACOH2F_05755 [Cellulomonas sp.]